MKVNQEWLEEWAKSGLGAEELCERLTMAGLEVDSATPVSGAFDGVVVGKVLSCEKHPDSDHMHVTTVDTGAGRILNIVCGAPNCRAGLKVCTAIPGAHVGELTITRRTLRGVASEGMLCSFKELGMAESSEGIIELPEDAPLGEDVRAYLKADDVCIDIDLTTNRPDCLSVIGVAREVAVLTGAPLKSREVKEVAPGSDERFKVTLVPGAGCPRYLARVIRGVNQHAKSPLWMVERLRRCGIRAISPIVDVTNYVMLERGQPLHSFDLNKLDGAITVRRAHEGEHITVLSGEELTLSENTLLITDDKGPVALAGVFGGLNSGIGDDTADVMLEAAFFDPEVIKGRARQYGLDTDAAHRFERGVDPEGCRAAIERATELLLTIAGGTPGPVCTYEDGSARSSRPRINLRLQRLKRVLGEDIPAPEVERILTRLDLDPEKTPEGFSARAPSFRFDLAIEEDLIEEVGRIYGYERIPNTLPVSDLRMLPAPEEQVSEAALKRELIEGSGYTEAITYSFTDPKALALFGGPAPIILCQPIAPEMSAMRTTLLAGLCLALRHNQNRQQPRVRLFESGLRYVPDAGAENGVRQERMLAAACLGSREKESWCSSGGALDFFTLKGEVESLFALGGRVAAYRPGTCPGLHPGQSADIYIDEKPVGVVGMLHPLASKALGLKGHVGVFEISYDALKPRTLPRYQGLSKFPLVRRDLAFVLPEGVSAGQLMATVRAHAGAQLREAVLFDVYKGAMEGVMKGVRDGVSLALGLTWQDETRTLEDAAVDAWVQEIIAACRDELKAELRGPVA